MEYQSITSYKQGAFVNVPAATQSLLLQKGEHTGPALTPSQYDRVQSWLTAEISYRAVRAASVNKPVLLPMVPLTTGDFTLSLASTPPINDPQAAVTLHLAPDVSNLYRVSELTLNAGPSSGIRIVHPRLYFITSNAYLADPADSLATVDMTIPAGASGTIGLGIVLLTNAPAADASVRLGMSFAVLAKTGDTGGVVCKDFPDFNVLLNSDLKACAAQCHSSGQNAAAQTAFDMSAANSTDTAMLQSLCVQSLGRIDTNMPDRSILLLQVIPVALGGTLNHWKYSAATDITRITNEVTTWAAGEH
jgi:hypothetical protein